MLKKRCKKCGEKVNRGYRFCPSCGNLMQAEDNQDWGMLGKEDIEEEDLFSDAFFKGFSGTMLNKMLGGAMKNAVKMLEEMEREKQKGVKMQNNETFPRTSVRLMINGQEINLNNSKKPKEEVQKTKKISIDNFSKENLKKFSELPKKEPKTSIKRFSDKIIYEIEMPGVKSMKDVFMNQLENSIEIKALSKEHAYYKLIPISLPVMDCELSEGKLVLELEAKN